MASVTNNGTIKGGIFKDAVTNHGTIIGGRFFSSVTNESDGIIEMVSLVIGLLRAPLQTMAARSTAALSKMS